jgi:hypothetical protein
MSLLVIYNPACGDRTAKSFVYEHVLPALKAAKAEPTAVIASERPGHAGEIVLQFLKDNKTHSTDVVIASGDGTIHEIVNALYENPASDGKPYVISFVIVPVGTANALFSSLFAGSPKSDITSPIYKLQSVHSYLADADPSSLTVTTTTVLPARPANTSQAASAWPARITVRSIVVTSTSLHASILYDSERLRASHPGIERFKIAAQENITRWYHASVRLLPLPSPVTSEVLKYSPMTHKLEPVTSDIIEGSNRAIELAGPFSYFLATGAVDRLEPEFRITPLVIRQPTEGASVDVVVVRPTADPSIMEESEEARKTFAPKIGKVLGDAYKEGSHVDSVYLEDGEVAQYEEGMECGKLPVEYFRCGGWEWTPVSSHGSDFCNNLTGINRARRTKLLTSSVQMELFSNSSHRKWYGVKSKCQLKIRTHLC